jgi:predicted RNA-binding protein (virulence factor B family)
MTNIHPRLKELPRDHRLHPEKVKQWIKINTDMLVSIRKDVRQHVKGAVAKQADIEGYIRNMRKYLKDGDWIDMFYGVKQEGRIVPRCVVMAYNSDGTAKRDVGTWYPDMGIYTKEMRDGE